jgi:hypothetical protein
MTRRKANPQTNKLHGEAWVRRPSGKWGQTDEYISWHAMMSRCFNPKWPNYADYGGRGVTVCAEWQDYRRFLADMGRRPSSEHSIDRYPNREGNYEPGNCRWATRSEQARNRVSNTVLTLAGVSLPLVAWAARTGIGRVTIKSRLDRGWSVEAALSTPVDPIYRARGLVRHAG